MVSKVCHCATLRTGSIIFAGFRLLADILSLVWFHYLVEILLLWMDFVPKNEIFWACLIITNISVVASACLLHGAINYNQYFVLAYLICDGIVLVAHLIAVVFMIIVNWAICCKYMDIFAHEIHWKATATLTTFTLWTYFLLCFYSFYKELKSMPIQITVQA